MFGFNGATFGAHAEYLSMPEDGLLATMPANLTYEEAAPSTEGSQYALSLISAAKIQSGQDVLVYGATGAIGSAAVQLLKRLGANVTAVGKSSFGRCKRLLKPGGFTSRRTWVRCPKTRSWRSSHRCPAAGRSGFRSRRSMARRW